MGKASKEEYARMGELFRGFGDDMKKTVSQSIHSGNGEKLLGDFTDRLKLITGEINKDPKLGTGEYLKRPAGMTYPGEKGYGNIDFKKGGTFGNVNMFGPAGGFGGPAGGPAGGPPGGGAAPKPVANNYIVDTASMVTAVNTSSTTTNSHLSQMVDYNKAATESNKILTAQAITLNTSIDALSKIQTNSYIELLRRTDVTNELLDTLIEATVDSSATPITLDGKRLNGALTNVRNRMYGLAKA